MSWKKLVLLGCVVPCVFAVSTATAQMRGRGGSMGRMGMRGGFMSRSMPRMGMRGAFTPRSMGRMPMHRDPMLGSMGRMPMHRDPMLGSMGRMPMHRDPMMNSPSGLRRWGDGDFDRDDRFDRFNHFNDGDFDRDDGFFRFNHVNEFIFIGDFGFPWWSWAWGPWWGWGPWAWGWGPWWGLNGSYPYGYYGGDYGSGYGYGDSSQSRVAELQRRLARAGYYHGAIDGIMGPATRRAIRAYERDNRYAG
jgi:putative peptidoglycan binding protein